MLVDVERRFWSKVDASGDCWEWSAARDPNGYGRFGVGRKVALTHRVAWEMLIGPIPDGMQIDHLCRNKACVNPDHLDVVTSAENTRRGALSTILKARHRAVTHCPQGHSYTEDNTNRSRDGRRSCKTCNRINARESMRRLRASRRAPS